jgi:hypothetical protein
MKEVRRHGDNVISTFEEFAGGTCEGRVFYRWTDGSWRPPLPFDIQEEAERKRSFGRAVLERSDASSTWPAWQLSNREPWRLRY